MPDASPLDIAALRQEYRLAGLSEVDAAPDPFAQFSQWLADALVSGIPEPNAMVLATVDETGAPSARTVLLKGVDERGFVFFTNRNSRKGRELAARPVAALTFPWISVARQVTVQGTVDPLPDAQSDAYFATRPRGSQVAAWASQQSEVLAGRELLEAAMAEAEQRFGDDPVPRPPHWGGYRVTPTEVEFWQGRPDRLHDRLRYRRSGEAWTVERLWP